MLNRLKNFWANLDPWIYMVVALSILAIAGIIRHGPGQTIVQLLIGPLVAGGFDFVYHGAALKKWFFPLSGVISGLICALVLPIGQSVAVGVAALLAVFLKQVLKVNDRHFFNPAGIGIVLVARWNNLPLGWWGESFLILTIVLGLANIIKVHRLPQVGLAAASYLGALYLARWQVNYPQSSAIVQTIQGAPWFFWLFMVPEPKTSVQPVGYQIVFGLIVGVAAVLFGYTPFQDYTWLYGLFVANLFAVFVRVNQAMQSVGRSITIDN